MNLRTKHAVLGLALLGTATLACAPAAVAQAQWPAKPVRMVVTYAPGGGADLMARLIAPKMQESLGQPVVVENRAGGGGTIGADFVAKSAPDGYTLMLDASNWAVNPSLYPKLPYDPVRGFAPVSLLVVFPNMLVVNPAFEAKSVQDLIALAKKQPGRIAYASSGNGSAQHLAAELFKQRAGLDMVHVPYKGGGPALQDVMGGQVPVFFANMASGLPHVKSGKVRALAVTGSKRSASAPDLPTIAEAGVPGYEVYEWNAVFAPAGTPAEIVSKTHAAIARALAAPEVRERITALGGEISALSPSESDKWFHAQVDKWARVVREAHIKLE
jgi:tripartite-type tricarboxylate transporter receptor subunit TctC